jgi:Mg2+/Co2+ transporter CorC
VDRLEEMAGEDWQPEESYEAQTVGGLVSEAVGRIPLVGEVVEVGKLRIEVVASSDRRVEQVRIHAIVPEAESTAEESKEDRLARVRGSNGNGHNGSNGNKGIEVE